MGVESEIARAVEVLARGGLIVYPTETLYGLGADATNDTALGRVAALKGRDAGKPIAVLVASRAMLDRLVARVPGAAARLIERFWPGPLTLVLPARADLSPVLTAGTGTVGARISSHPTAQAIVAALDRPLTATSANPGGEAPPGDVAAARAYFDAKVDAYVDRGPTAGGPPSTVLDLSGERPALVREGAIRRAALEAVGGITIARR